MRDQERWFGVEDIRRAEAGRLSRRRFVGLGAGMVAGGTLLAACGDDDDSSGSGGGGGSDGSIGEGKKIGLVLNGFNQYCQDLATGVLEGLNGTAYEFVGLQGNFDAAQEVANFEAMVSRNVDGIVVLPNTVQGASRGSLAAKAAGIPVSNLLWSEPTPGDAAFVVRVGVDSVKGGELIGEWITENTDPGKVLVVSGVPGQGFSEDITEGLTKSLAATGGGDWKIAAEQPGLFTRTKAIDAAQNMLTAHPDAKILVTYAAEMGNGVASYLQKSGRDDIVHISDDGNDQLVEQLRDGLVQSIRYYAAGTQGLTGTKALREYLEDDKKFPDPIQLNQGMATKDDIDQWLKREPLNFPQYRSEVKKIG
jgi:ribose transport system substrate-binding protein